MRTLFNEKLHALSEFPASKLGRILNFMEIEQELIPVLHFATFHKYLISTLSMNANDLGFKTHNIHYVILSPHKEKTTILFPSLVMASYSFFHSLTFLMNI